MMRAAKAMGAKRSMDMSQAPNIPLIEKPAGSQGPAKGNQDGRGRNGHGQEGSEGVFREISEDADAHAVGQAESRRYKEKQAAPRLFEHHVEDDQNYDHRNH